MTQITLDAQDALRIRDYLLTSIESGISSLKILEEHGWGKDDAVREFSQRSLDERQALLETVETALGLKTLPQPGDRIRVVKHQGIYVRAGREGVIVKKVSPEEAIPGQYGSDEDIWKIDYQPHPGVDDQEMQCHTRRSEFVILENTSAKS